MVRASASVTVDMGLIPSRVKLMTLKIGIHSFFAGRSALKEQCRKQAGKLLVVPLKKALMGIPSSWCGRQMAGNF